MDVDPTALLNAGVAGVVAAWFMFRAESRMKLIEAALDRLTRSQLLTLLARPDVDEPVKAEARRIYSETAGPAHPETGEKEH